ncbi:MAG: hypothetical protein NC489_17315 [Ruminococcus flavefaciens]|nr:hypothetical protein [Ruminococcus flavefaciens]
MAKKQIAVTALVGITAFAAGFLLRSAWNDFPAEEIQTGSVRGEIYQSENGSTPAQSQILSQETNDSDAESAEAANTVSIDNIQVRVDDGLIQWYDGNVWHTVAAVEELSQEDKFYQALETFQIFSRELQQEKAETSSQIQQSGAFWDEDSGLSVGKKETPKPTPKPAATQPAAGGSAAQEPTTESPAASAPNTPAASSTPSTPSTPATPSTPDTPSTPATPSTPDTPSTPATPSTPDTPSTPAPSEGDGEDMEWTPDFE